MIPLSISGTQNVLFFVFLFCVTTEFSNHYETDKCFIWVCRFLCCERGRCL